MPLLIASTSGWRGSFSFLPSFLPFSQHSSVPFFYYYQLLIVLLLITWTFSKLACVCDSSSPSGVCVSLVTFFFQTLLFLYSLILFPPLSSTSQVSSLVVLFFITQTLFPLSVHPYLKQSDCNYSSSSCYCCIPFCLSFTLSVPQLLTAACCFILLILLLLS